MEVGKAEEINQLQLENGIIATLIKHPEFVLYSESELRSDDFVNKENKCIYVAILKLVIEENITTIDPYNIISYLDSKSSLHEFAHIVSPESLNDFVSKADLIARHTVDEYMLCVSGVREAAFRREVFLKLDECQQLCIKDGVQDLEQKVYNVIDNTMTKYQTRKDIVPYREVIDGYWEQIQSRQANDGFAGVPFKFPTLNQYVTMERGELIIVGAEAKHGKSIFLLNEAVDLLRRDLSVIYIDSELNSRLFTARMLSHLSSIEFRRLTSGCYSDEEAERIDQARAWLKTRKFTHIYMPMLDEQGIYSAVKKMRHSPDGLDVVIMDYFKGSGTGDAWSSYVELGHAVDMIKNRVAGDMNLMALGAAQSLPSGKLADSSKIARNASTILLLQDKTREEMEADGLECGNRKLIVTLNRNGMQHAPGEYIDLDFSGDLIKFEEARQHIPEAPY